MKSCVNGLRAAVGGDTSTSMFSLSDFSPLIQIVERCMSNVKLVISQILRL